LVYHHKQLIHILVKHIDLDNEGVTLCIFHKNNSIQRKR
jgi:hypothetical protein